MRPGAVRLLILSAAIAVADLGMSFVRLREIQFIAALGDPNSSAGNGAHEWGIWTIDPGPRGVRLEGYKALEANQGRARAGWTFDRNDWWLEEHGLIMEKPEFPVKPGRYMVTGGRETTTVLTIRDDGSWQLDGGVSASRSCSLPCPFLILMLARDRSTALASCLRWNSLLSPHAPKCAGQVV